MATIYEELKKMSLEELTTLKNTVEEHIDKIKRERRDANYRQLTARQAEVWNLVHENGLSLKDAAKELGITVTRVHQLYDVACLKKQNPEDLILEPTDDISRIGIRPCAEMHLKEKYGILIDKERAAYIYSPKNYYLPLREVSKLSDKQILSCRGVGRLTLATIRDAISKVYD